MFKKQASYQRTQVVENTFLKNKVLHPQAFMFQYLWIPEYNMQICNVLLFYGVCKRVQFISWNPLQDVAF